MISVLLPTYARPEFLRESIECFLRQTYTDSELVVLNDWTGHTIHFEHPRVRVFNKTDGERRSLGEVRNWLCSQARGDVVTDWDDDDIYLPKHLEHALSMMEKYRGSKFSKQRWQWKWNIKNKMFRICPAGYLHTAMMNKQARDALGGYADRTRHSDAEFITRLINGRKLAGISGSYFHEPTFIQRFGMGREHVSAGPSPDETDVDRHKRIDLEAASLGVTGEVVIVPQWTQDYEKIAADSFAAVVKTGWGK
jgi:glycosyltransferase involved in cell wall biosynthesis